MHVQYLGAIMGVAGEKLAEVRRDSGANVSIEEAPPAAPERIITIAGSSEQIDHAQYLLQMW